MHDVSSPSFSYHRYPVYYIMRDSERIAAKTSDETELQLLLPVSADVNCVVRGQQHRGASGGTALLSVCLHKHRRAVEILLEHGAKVDKSDEEAGWWAPLLVASGTQMSFVYCCQPGRTGGGRLTPMRQR
jgi:hypothetical protein